jgi:hypothetical protein
MPLKKTTRFCVKRMFMPVTLLLLLSLSTTVIFAGTDDDQSHIITQLEVGPVWQGRNDVQIPNDQSGTRFSLVDLVGTGPFLAVRFYFTWRIAPRHDLRLLLAPLQYIETGNFDAPVSFAGQNYVAAQPVNATYKFNSWRLTYRYKFHTSEQWHLWVGFTAKIRDAKIKLEQGSYSSEKTDLGFVPLLHFRAEYHLNPDWWIFLDLDALAGGPGRAEDATLQIAYNFNNNWSLSAGYRTLEGGADVEEVYNFAWLHYIVVGLRFML